MSNYSLSNPTNLIANVSLNHLLQKQSLTRAINLSANCRLLNKSRGVQTKLSNATRADLNGIIINQNLQTPSSTKYSTSKYLIQEFKLPADFKRGYGTQQKNPQLTGFHLNVLCSDETFTINYDLQVYDELAGWQGIAYGKHINKSGLGLSQWTQINFDPIEIKDKYVNKKFRLILTLDNKITGIYWSNDNALKSSNCFLYENTVANYSRSLRFRLLADVADEGVDILGNTYRSLVYRQSINDTLDYNTNTWWMSKANPSKYGVECLYFNLGSKTPIDSIFLDPATPNMTFNIYYTEQIEVPNHTLADWDNMLWERVPKEFVASKRQNYILPSPINTKFIKIEFSSLQMKPYLTGDFHRPVLYRKHPQWVFDYFMARYAYERDMTYDPFIANRIDINFDLLDLAFNYYKDDIIQYSTNPAKIKVVNEKTENLDQLLRNLLVESDGNVNDLDIPTYMKIKTEIEKYTRHPAFSSDPGLQSGAAAINSADLNNYPTEDFISQVASTSVVSNHNRDHLITEKRMPNMYFFIKCRHGYKEALAKLPSGKAYFAGVKEIGFHREDHKVVYDNAIYMTVAGDNLNSAVNDFEYNGESWTSGFDNE